MFNIAETEENSMRPWLFSILQKLQIRSFQAVECGHKTKRLGTWTAHGEMQHIFLFFEDGNTPYCHDCIENMTIQCAWCSRPIFVGDEITLNTHYSKTWSKPSYAVEYNKNRVTYMIGCMRIDCVESEMSFSGYWIIPGKVDHRYATKSEKTSPASMDFGEFSDFDLNQIFEDAEENHIKIPES